MLLLSFRKVGSTKIVEIGLLSGLDLVRDRDIIVDIAAVHSKNQAKKEYPKVEWDAHVVVIKDTSDTTFSVRLGGKLNQKRVYILRDIPTLNDFVVEEEPTKLALGGD